MDIETNVSQNMQSHTLFSPTLTLLFFHRLKKNIFLVIPKKRFLEKKSSFPLSVCGVSRSIYNTDKLLVATITLFL